MSSACLGVQDDCIQDQVSATLFYKIYAASVQESYHLVRQLRIYGRNPLGLSVHACWESVIPVSVRVRLDRVSPCKRPDLGRNSSRLENVWNLYWCVVWCSSAQHSTMVTSCTVGWQRRGSYSRHVLGSMGIRSGSMSWPGTAPQTVHSIHSVEPHPVGSQSGH